MTARIVVAGASSGSGKTTLMVGLAAAFRARGLSVALFKCGPDYLDPTYHARVTGVPSQNLDGWMMGRDAVASTFVRAAAGADIALIEGVMGLHDGSTADIAKWLGTPVLAVVDASGMGRTVAAVAQGLAQFDPELRVAGVVCNRVGSRSHLDLVRAAASTPPIIGGLPERADLSFPERHLGLRTADESLDPSARGRVVAEWVDLDAVLAIARSADPLSSASFAPISAVGRCRIGLAFDEAFHFYYDDNLRRLEALGTTLVRFSPIRDVRLPDVDGLYLGGGYPELAAEALGANRPMQDAIRAFRGPIYAECGGLMYLCDAIRTLEGQVHPMVGLLPGEAVMADKLQALGHVEVETQVPTILGPAGLRFRGHQFRYSSLVTTAGCAYTVRRRRGNGTEREGYGAHNVLASYVHAHWASNPRVADGFVRSCSQ
jgi:cobyrinic acid a,c-diamide synthase